MSDGAAFECEEERIDRDAADWIARRGSGFTPEERFEFEEWLSRDQRHRETLDAYEEMRASFGLVADLILDLDEEPDPNFLEPLSLQPKWRRWKLPAALAALAACIAIAYFVTYSMEREFGDEELFYAASFEARTFERQFLPDGSLLELRAGASVEVKFDGERRFLELTQGEAYFSVAKDLDRPFVVRAGKAEFTALGTAFNIRLSAREVEILVTEGVVRVDKAILAEDLLTVIDPRLINEALQANHRVTINLVADVPDPEVKKVDTRKMDEQLSWKHETLRFDGVPLSKVILEFNLRNRDQMEIADKSLGDEEIDGTFRSDNLEAFIEIIELSAKIEVDRSTHGKVIFRGIADSR